MKYESLIHAIFCGNSGSYVKYGDPLSVARADGYHYFVDENSAAFEQEKLRFVTDLAAFISSKVIFQIGLLQIGVSLNS